jgi:hypothetical protein
MSPSQKYPKLHPVDNTAVFGLPAIHYRASILKKILTIFRQKLKPRQTRKQLLERVNKLSESLSTHDFQAVSGHLKRGVEITRKSLAEWPTFPSPDSTPDVKNIQKRPIPKLEWLECELCLEHSSNNAIFRIGKLDPGCNHVNDVCEKCLSHYLSSYVQESRQWTEIPCPTCNVIISPHVVRSYLNGESLER